MPARAGALAVARLLGASATAAAWQARRPATDVEAAILLDFAARSAERFGRDHAVAARPLGALLPERGRNGALAPLEAPPGPFRPRGIDVREPVRGGAIAGPLAFPDVEGPCVDGPRIERRFGRLAPDDVPRGVSMDETTVWSLALPGRTSGFGFGARGRDRLAAVSLDIPSPPTGANR